MTWCVGTVCFLVLALMVVQSACNLKLQGIKDELKHIDRSLRQISPEYKKVLLYF
jgi:hypothetical protein